MTEYALSILILIFSAQLQQTETSDRKLFIFHLGTTIGIGDRAATNRLRDCDNAAEIGDDTTGIVDIAAKVIPF